MSQSGVGTTKYQLFIKGIRGENVAIIVHKVSSERGQYTLDGRTVEPPWLTV